MTEFNCRISKLRFILFIFDNIASDGCFGSNGVRKAEISLKKLKDLHKEILI
jgi:hypothetical protein